MSQDNEYDYIIAGAGCSGLSLAIKLKNSNVDFNKVLLVDADRKTKNDRTWCFWSKKQDEWYEPIIYKSWDYFSFKSPEFSSDFALKPYRYHMIRGIDFYNFCLNELKKDKRFEFINGLISELNTTDDGAYLRTEDKTYHSNYIFNSALRNQSKKQHHINYIQHFLGWVVETELPLFNVHLPLFMDFRVDQHNDLRFVYLLPISENRAMVEYTGFSPSALTKFEYEKELKNYLQHFFNLKTFKVLETEYGEIPMSESEFNNPFGSNVINIGTAGGYTKPSTGYTFYFIQKYTDSLIIQLERKERVLKPNRRESKYLNYDRIMLDVINSKKIEGREIFSSLFKNNNISTLLDFLNEETTPWQDIAVMNSVPIVHFMFSAIKKSFGS